MAALILSVAGIFMRRPWVQFAFFTTFVSFAFTTASAQIPKEEILSQLKGMCAIANEMGGFKLEATSRFALEEKYLRINPQVDRKKYGKVEETYSVYTNGALFRIATKYRLLNGEMRPPNTLVFDGSNTMFTFSEGRAMSIKNGFKITPDNSMPLGTVLYLPYGFLLPCEEPDKIALLTPSLVNSAGLWSSLPANVSVVPNSEPDLTKLRINHFDGSYFIVTLHTPECFPKSYELYSAAGKLQLDYQTLSLGVIHHDGKKMSYAKEALFNLYVEGFKRSERRITIDSVEFRNDFPGPEFSSDPASAEVIFDEEAKKSIRVPK